MVSFLERLRKSWNVFKSGERYIPPLDGGFNSRPDRRRMSFSNERSIISSIYTRLSIDVAAIPIRHCRLDEENRFLEEINSGLNECLSVEANIDQANDHFIRDLVLTLLDTGVAAAVAVETTDNPDTTSSYDVLNLRVGEVVDWKPRDVKVRLYNELLGERTEIWLPKRQVAIIQNPLYPVMNETSSTLQRLVSKLNMLDAIDQQSSSGKLDVIIQLPYVIRSQTRKEQAEERRKDIEMQLKGSQYGIAYIDGTEKITQLNRPAENNLLKQVEYLTALLYKELGLTESVFDGTADEATMLNYHNRTVGPILTAITNEFKRTFLTKTARTQGQSIRFFRDPFMYIPVGSIAEIADKFTRNEVLSSNEIRDIIGRKPSSDPNANKLKNKNLPAPEEKPVKEAPSEEVSNEDQKIGQNGS